MLLLFHLQWLALHRLKPYFFKQLWEVYIWYVHIYSCTFNTEVCVQDFYIKKVTLCHCYNLFRAYTYFIHEIVLFLFLDSEFLRSPSIYGFPLPFMGSVFFSQYIQINPNICKIVLIFTTHHESVKDHVMVHCCSAFWFAKVAQSNNVTIICKNKSKYIRAPLRSQHRPHVRLNEQKCCFSSWKPCSWAPLFLSNMNLRNLAQAFCFFQE